MTCIVGVADGKRVWIGGDSAATSGWDLTIRTDPKVFENGPMVFGFTSSFRMGQLLHHRLVVPKQGDENDHRWLCTTFIDSVRQCLKDGGFARTESGEDKGGDFLVGYRGHLYRVASDYQVAESADQYDAVGCGGDFALGAMRATKGPPNRRITEALSAAEHFSAGVAGPFRIVVGGKA